jgi:mycothiol S-conjugate amidase
MSRAQEVLGVQHRWLGYQDSGLPGEGETVPAGSFSLVPLEISAAPLVKLIREYRPQVMVTYDESGGYPHPDHIRTHEVAVYAMDAAADPSRYPDLGDAWQTSKLYYDRIFSTERTNRVYDELVASEPDSPLIAQFDEMRTWMRDRPNLATTMVDVGAFFEHRDRALRAHASQVPPDSQFFFWPNDIQRRAWPYENFQLVRSLVETELPETDLFAGIVDDQKAEA